MTFLIAHPGSRMIADTVAGRISRAGDLVLIAGGTLTVAILAQVSVPLWPVPVPGQTLAVGLVGAAVGARRFRRACAASALAGLIPFVFGLPIDNRR